VDFWTSHPGLSRAALVPVIAASSLLGVFGPTAAPRVHSHAAASPPGACGNESVPAKPDGAAWTCAFDDEFDRTTGDATTLDTSSWTPQLSATSGYTTGPPGANVCYLDSPTDISVSDGVLHLTVRREATPFPCGSALTQYSGGMVSTANHFSQTYGRIEVRARLPQTTGPGVQETFWLWPVEDARYGAWPASGEIDFSEFYGRYSWFDIPYIHYDYDPSATNSLTGENQVTGLCPISPSEFNDYALTWSPGSFTITVNGATCLTDNYAPTNVRSPAPFDQPFFVVLTQALGVGANAFAPSRTGLPATTSVDYVRVWK
jgi:beta-glucanase (GH16 family)